MDHKPIYPSDLTASEWQEIKHMLPKESELGRPREHGLREILNGIFYLLRSGCSWRMLPHDYAPWQTIYGYFRRWSGGGLIERIHDRLRETLRRADGSVIWPTAAVLDSQSVRTPDTAGERGYDAGKKLKGRKRHLLVDTLGLVLAVKVTPANVQDRDGARTLLSACYFLYRWLACIWADSGYAGALV
jgi:putative transposase